MYFCIYFVVLDTGVEGHYTAAYALAVVRTILVTTLYRAIDSSI